MFWILITNVHGRMDVLWFPLSDNVRNVILVYTLRSDRKIKGDIRLNVSIKSPNKKEFLDSVKNKSPNSNYIVMFYEGAIGWDEANIKSRIKGKSFEVGFEKSISGYKTLKTSSLILAYNISKDDSMALFKRNGLFIRPCFECVFYDRLGYYLEVVSDSSYTIIGVIKRGDEIVLRLPPKVYKTSSTIYSFVPLSDLKEGKYTLLINIISPSSGESISLERDFYVSPFGDDIASFIDYIATPDEKKEFQKAITLEARLNFLKRFWQKRGMKFYLEFRNRVIHADTAFATPTLKGRYTDMGRIYIKKGKPDEIDRVDVSLQDKPYIRWVYYTGGGYNYIFGDPVGTGEYVLIKTNDPEEIKYIRPSGVPSLDINPETHWGW